MNKTNTKICEVIDAWPPHSFVHRHVSSMAILGESLFPIAVTHANDASNQASIQRHGERQIVSILPQLRRPFLLSLLPGIQRFLASPWGIRLKQWRMEQKLFPAFKKIRPDLIHFHWIGLAISFRWIPETLGIPYTVSLRGSEVRVQTMGSVEKTEQIKTTLEHASGIHTVCQNLGRHLEYYPFGEIPTTTIYTCVTFPDQLPPYPVVNGTIQFLTVGRLHWTKGFSDVLWALKRLQDHHVPWQLTMAGHGPDEDRIRFWINQLGLQPQVRLLGKVTPSMVQTLLRSSHAYLQSSLSEGLSNSLAEAMANGCPVFATNVGGTTEVVQDRKNGVLLTPMKPETWLEPMKLVRDTSVMMRIRQEAYETARKLFSSSNHANQFITFYNKAITNSQSRLHSLSRKDPVTYQGNGRKGFLTEDVKKILVLGDWEWPIGVDGVMRVIGGIIQKVPHLLICKVVGCGSQKEELQYLCNFMNVLQHVELVEVEKDDEGQITRIQEEWGDCIINCHRYGEISMRYSESRLEVKNLEKLEKVLLSYLDPNQKISVSTSVGITQA
jgi:colanic acid/amylovoran biosynthesis glycosyltransferase